MSDGSQLPSDPLLRDAADVLERSGTPAELIDADWRLVYVTSQLREIVGVDETVDLGIGRHMLARGAIEAWVRTVTPESARAWLEQLVPLIAADTPDDLDELVALLGDANPAVRASREMLERLWATPDHSTFWTGHHVYPREDGPDSRIARIGVRLRDDGGLRAGAAIVYFPGLPGSVIEMIVRGDPANFERIANLAEPRRRAGAVMFADLEASTSLSRRLSTSAWFDLIGRFAAAADAAVVGRSGILGRHAGDGLVAFFLTQDCGDSDSRAARNAIDAARSIAATVDGLELPGDESVDANVALHWSDAMVVGQLVTAGRLEVTALGDAVNETARIESVAAGGTTLASKSLIERLEPDDAGALGLDPMTLTYTPLGELAGAGEKARRDAGLIPVTALAGPPG